MDITKTKHSTESEISVFSNREIKCIVKDSSCMFRCLTQHLFNSQDKHQVVHQILKQPYLKYTSPLIKASLYEHV